MRKKIFITGGTGFIGKEVVKVLAETKKYDLIVLTRKNLISYYKYVKFVTGDILDKTSFQDHIKDSNIVLHMAGLSTGNDNEIKKVNILGTRNIIDLSKNKKVIFISSENVLYKNHGTYGESKKSCEDMLKKRGNYLILRVSIVYGKYDKTRLSKIVNWCKKWPIIFIPGNGNGLMQPIFVEDIAFFILNAIEKDKGGEFILAGPSSISLNEFINEIGKITGKKILKIHIPLFILYPFVKLNEILLNNPFIKFSQLKNLNAKRIYNIDKTIREFSHTPLNIEEGLKKTL